MNLSQAIREGCAFNPQGTSQFYTPWENSTCALGAAYLATYGELPIARSPLIEMKQEFKGNYMDRMRKTYPILNERMEDIYGHLKDVAQFIVNKNDSGETREEIADWIENLERKQWSIEDTRNVLKGIVDSTPKMIIAKSKNEESLV